MDAQVQLLKEGLQQAGLWPQPGEVAPPRGGTPQQLRRSIRDFAADMDDEILFAAYQVMLLMWTMRKVFYPSDADYEEGQRFKHQALRQANGILRQAAKGGPDNGAKK